MPHGATFPKLDAALCTACGACEVACVTARYPEVPRDVQPDDPIVLERRRLAIRIVDPGPTGDPSPTGEPSPTGDRPIRLQPGMPSLDVCIHCADSPCVPVCPHNALVRFPGGRVELIEPRCTGCGACIGACPYKAIRRVTALSIAVKCDGCAPMDRPGHVVPIKGGPACVAACPTGALKL